MASFVAGAAGETAVSGAAAGVRAGADMATADEADADGASSAALVTACFAAGSVVAGALGAGAIPLLVAAVGAAPTDAATSAGWASSVGMTIFA